MEPVIERPALSALSLPSLVQQLMTVFQQFGYAINRLLRGPRYPLTPLEEASGLTADEIDDLYVPGYLYRYGENTTPGTTNMSAAMHAAIATGHRVIVPPEVNYCPDIDDTVLSVSLRMVGEKGLSIIDGGDTGFFDFSNKGGSIDEIHVEGVTFQNMGGHTIRCFDGVMPVAAFTVIEQFTFIHNTIRDSNSGPLLFCKVKKLLYTHNRILNLVAATSSCQGLQAGSNFRELAEVGIDDLEDFTVTDNQFDHIEAQTADVEAHAVILYGTSGSIANNTVRNVLNSGNGAGAEGLYTKMRFVSITGNTLIDAGTGEGFLAIKGNQHTPVPLNHSPSAWGAIVQHNKFVQTEAGTNVRNGVFVHCSECKINDNSFEGLGGSCVVTQHDFEIDNVETCRNTVRDHYGEYVFQQRHYGRGMRLNDNTVYNWPSNANFDDVYALRLEGNASQGDWHDWEVCRNQVIVGTSAATAHVRCINIAVNTGNTAYGLKVEGNVMSNAQASILETGLNISTGTYERLTVRNNDAQAVDGVQQLTVFGTITSAWFEGNLFVAPFQTANTDVELHDVNTIATNRTAAGGARTYTLPVSFPGLEYKFTRANSGTMAVDPDGTETIRGTTGAGATVDLNNIGSCLTLRCDEAGTWEVISAFDVTLN